MEIKIISCARCHQIELEDNPHISNNSLELIREIIGNKELQKILGLEITIVDSGCKKCINEIGEETIKSIVEFKTVNK